jgi:glutamine synthetase
MSKIIAEYIWIDGTQPMSRLRSKSKVLSMAVKSLDDIPNWGFDGSSTMQAESHDSDCLLEPVSYVPDPVRGGNNILVMCEVFNADGSVHVTNKREHLREVAKKYKKEDVWFGLEQEYTLMDGAKPYGWPEHGFPAPQGKYYCGVGADEVYGRAIIEDHMRACLDAGLALSGINAEVMPAQWEFQIGPLGPLEVSDQLWIARWLLYRVAEKYNIGATIHPKPVRGDWNGAGMHTNFSTKAMRSAGGVKVIESAMKKLAKKHKQHLAVYGAYNVEERLLGLYETSHPDKFTYGVSDRGASVRIPMATVHAKKGYFEDRRPAASMDPYQGCAILIETVCGK